VRGRHRIRYARRRCRSRFRGVSFCMERGCGRWWVLRLWRRVRGRTLPYDCGQGQLSALKRLALHRDAYFDITCVMRVFASAEEAQASIRACKFEPLPEMRTVRLYCGGDDMMLQQEDGLSVEMVGVVPPQCAPFFLERGDSYPTIPELRPLDADTRAEIFTTCRTRYIKRAIYTRRMATIQLTYTVLDVRS
jgi:hypothetical protein